MGSGHRDSTQENHKHHEVKFNTNQIIHTMKAFPRKGGIPTGSIDLTCSICQQEGDQHGPQAEK